MSGVPSLVLYQPCGDSVDVPEVRQRMVGQTTVGNGAQRRGQTTVVPGKRSQRKGL